MNEPAEDRRATHLCEIGIVNRGWRDRQGPRCLLAERAMRAVVVVMSDVLG